MAGEADELYALPLEEFIRARNELARRLQDPSIRELKKPSVSAWAANQLARKREVDVRRLLRAGERLEEAQRGIVVGGDRREFATAQKEERDAVRRLREEAAQILGEAGHPASDATLERLGGTLHAAAATEEGRAALRSGRLVADLEPLGFGALQGVAPRAGGRRPRPRSAPDPRPSRRLQKARDELTSARQEAEAAEKEARSAEREADRARRAAERAAERVARLESRLDELRRD